MVTFTEINKWVREQEIRDQILKELEVRIHSESVSYRDLESIDINMKESDKRLFLQYVFWDLGFNQRSKNLNT